MSIIERMGSYLKIKNQNNNKKNNIDKSIHSSLEQNESNNKKNNNEKHQQLITTSTSELEPSEFMDFVEKNIDKSNRVILKCELTSGTETREFLIGSEDTFNFDNKNLNNIEKVILKAILMFRKYNEKFIVEEVKYIVQSPTELNLFEAIKRTVHKKLHRKTNLVKKKCEICGKYQNEILLPKEIDNANLGKLVHNFKADSIKFMAIKAIIVTLVNLMNQIIKDFIENLDDLNDKLFCLLYEQFLFMSNICPYLEQDFINSFRDFKQTYQINFSLCDLFGEIFWDCIFKFKDISKLFLESYLRNDLGSDIRLTLQKIVKALWLTNDTLKSKIIEKLEISSLFGNKNPSDLATCILKQKELNKDNYDDPYLLEENSKTLSKIESTIRSLDYKDTPDKSPFSKFDKLTTKELFANITMSTIATYNLSNDYKLTFNDDENGQINNETYTISAKELQSFDDYFNALFNQSEEESNRPTTPPKSNNNHNANKKTGKKNNNAKKKKRKKNKTRDKTNCYDPIVEEFKNEIGWDNNLHAREIQKITPIISTEWLKSIS